MEFDRFSVDILTIVELQDLAHAKHSVPQSICDDPVCKKLFHIRYEASNCECAWDGFDD